MGELFSAFFITCFEKKFEDFKEKKESFKNYSKQFLFFKKNKKKTIYIAKKYTEKIMFYKIFHLGSRPKCTTPKCTTSK